MTELHLMTDSAICLQAVHVGDSWSRDVVGATAAGYDAVYISSEDSASSRQINQLINSPSAAESQSAAEGEASVVELRSLCALAGVLGAA